jgi:glutathione reductase (NADPH)
MAFDYDLIAIGAGNAGLAAARTARAAGKRVLVVEARELGGTCPLRGCVPKKVLVAAAEVLDTIARAGEHGIEVAEPRLDWGKLIARKRTFVEGVPADFERSLEKRGIDLLHGQARFAGRNAIEVDGRRITAAKLVVATGAKPRPLPIDGAGELAISDDLLEQAELPESVIFVGAGVVAMEFAHVLARAGSKVTLLEADERPLGPFDAELVEVLAGETRRIGVELHCGVRVERIGKSGDGFEVEIDKAGAKSTLSARLAVNGAGRVADLAELALDRAGVELDGGKRPMLDRFLRSATNPDVLFAGDTVPGTPQLSPLATYEGTLAARNAFGENLEPDYLSVPAVVFTIPPLAMVGLRQADAERRGLELEVRLNDLAGWRSGRTYAETAARSKVLLEKGSRRILGAHLLGHGAAETIHAFAFCIKHGLSARELEETVTAYPTFHADLKYML